MSKVWKCYRCGNFYKGAKSPRTKRVVVCNVDDVGLVPRQQYDLCPTCYKEFLQFIGEDKK